LLGSAGCLVGVPPIGPAGGRRYQEQVQNEPGQAISTKLFLLEGLRARASGVAFI
jgi:hypothetical protein